MYNKNLLRKAYQKAIEDAKKNLTGEDLEKCLIALNNYMTKFDRGNNA